MGRHSPNPRDRFVAVPRSARPQRAKARQGGLQTSAIMVFHNDDDPPSSTASTFIEDAYDPSPIPTGLLDANGDEICRIPGRDWLPVGFHYTPDQYDEFGDFIGASEGFESAEDGEEDDPEGAEGP